MQCFQQLPAASVFPGFHFHTLLSFHFVVFSPRFVSCFHLPWPLAALYCVIAVLNPVGLERQVCLGVLVPLGYSTHPIARAVLKGHSVLRSSHGTGWMTADCPYWTWSAHCPSPHIACFGSGTWVFPASSPGGFPNSNSLWYEKKSENSRCWWLPARRVRVTVLALANM